MSARDEPTLVTGTRVRELADGFRNALHTRVDRMFVVLLACQWVAMVVLAVWVTPLTWAGSTSRTHPHVWVALLLGGMVVSLPIALAVGRPGRANTRFVIAAAQMLSTGLLIHLTGGRIETHFHVFGSLAFLAFYRDWRVLLVASGVTALDHVVRGFAWPESVYGSTVGAEWRWVEHAGWVVFLDLFLVLACWWGERDLVRVAEREAALEAAHATVGLKIQERTAELWQQQELFRGAFDHAAVGMAMLTPDGRFVRVNRLLCELVGYPEDELLALTFAEITHPDDRAGDRECVADMHSGQTSSYQREKRYLRKDGQVVWVQVNVSLVRDAAGRPNHVVSQVSDLTSRKRAEQAVRASEERYRTLIAATTAIVWNSPPSGAFDTDQPEWTAFTGQTVEEHRGYGWLDVIHPEDRERTGVAWVTAIGGKGDYQVEHRIRRADGVFRHMTVRATPILETDGTIREWVGVHTDVTEQRRAQQEQAERERLATFAAAVGTAFTSVGSFADALQAVTEAMVRFLGAAFARVWTAEENGATLVLRASAGLYTHTDGGHARVPVGQFKIGRIAADRTPHLTNAVQTDPQVGDHAWAVENGLVSFAGHPLVVGGKMVGVMAMFARQPLSPATLEALATVADGLALGVERQRAEHAFRESEERFRAAMEGSLDSVYFLAADRGPTGVIEDFRFTDLNQRGCELLARTREQVVGRRLCQMLPVNRTGGFFDKYVRVVETGDPLEEEFRVAASDGLNASWLHHQVIRVGDGVTITTQDITARKQAEQALRVSEERSRKLSLVASRTHNGVIITDAAGRLEWVNEAFTRLTGYTLDEMRGRKPGEVLQGPDTDPQVSRHMGEQIRNGRGFQVEVVNYSKGGRRYWLSIDAQPVFDEGGRLTNFVAIEQDVTASRQVNEELRRATAEAEAASRAKSEFLANMSHEIRTPMNGVLGMTDLLLETELTADQRASVGLVKSSADALLTVINDILDFSKIEAGKLDLDPVPFSLRDTVGDTLKALAARAHAKGLELAFDAHPGVPDLLTGDAHRLLQVLTNLVGNAIKFTARGEVVVRCERVTAGGDPAATVRMRFAVADTGIGIPSDKLRAVFEPFTQADGSTTRKYGGTGLGLTICQRLVELMGGRVWAESEHGKGSTFFFEVRLEPCRGSFERRVEVPADLTGREVLIVDDNATNRRVLAELVRHWGGRPTSVASGREGLDELKWATTRGTPFPLVLLDGMMPEMDGYQVAEHIRQDAVLADTTVVMLTSADRQGDAARCRALGVSFLVKPVKPAELNRAIATAFASSHSSARGVPALVRPKSETAVADIRPLRILVAEDNPVNQKVITGLLAKGSHTVTVAGDGRQAVAAFDARPFDVVLMDVQMPEMDGFEATAAIRQRDAAGGRHTLIVAMTAHAMKGDRERCLAAGMDEYVSKPVQRSELFRVLEWVAGQTPAATPSPAVPTPAPRGHLPPLDRAAAIERLGGDEELFAEVATEFRGDAPKLIDQLSRAVAAGDAPTVRRAAHGLKGAAGYVGGGPTVAAAAVMEQIGASGDLTAAGEALNLLAREVTRLTDALS